ncbi:hypothetical protein QBC45DRAFT_66709 [Copromyces sp. CBS 386.78]|nr:hypothetical protein QBC45DRAFT_66709 [Copromyces sp. CBS 386.78]
MPTSTLTRVAHRAVLLRPGARATATATTATSSSSRHFFLPSTVIPFQQRSAPSSHQQRFATVDTSGRRGGGSGSGSGSGNVGGGGKAAETTMAADIDSDLDYPTEMDERYSTSSYSEASRSSGAASSPSGSGFSARPEKTAAGIGSEPNRPSYKSNAASDGKVGSGKADNTLFYLAMGLVGLSGAYIVLKPNPSASLEPGVDARSSSSQQQHNTPAHRPLTSKTEKMIGRGG